MRAHLFVPVLFAISSLGGVALAERSAGGGASNVSREHVAREHVVREHVVRERAARPAIERLERVRAHGDLASRPARASSSSGRPDGGGRPSGSSLRSRDYSTAGTACAPGSPGCGDRSRPATPARESHFTRATAKAPSAEERRALEKLVQVLQAKICEKAHCGEQ